ncbi:Regulator of drug sensitivity 2 [Sphaceloma murrayae]|uniref:Regulator of drug sensitivity 2 n=1 Tax=Sphaceloma murrayae TaxID=2082308 RepID=A0A2K1R2N9_9PEZI|nr:Regulator of drug sensitivity 2 [Sphaceloma murrayae]
MPRPKVDPNKRLRAAEACTYCQSTKKRCSAIVPCSNCVRKGRAHQCTLAKGKGDAYAPASRIATQRPRQRTSRAPSSVSIVPVDSLLSNASLSPAATTATNQSRPSAAGAVSSPDASHRTQPRILQGSQGERVYIGGSASLSFLQFIRDTVSQYVGPTQFTNDAKQSTMHEDTSVPTPLSPFMETNLSLDEKTRLVDAYVTATSGFIDVLTRSEAVQLISDHNPQDLTANTCRSAMADLVLAIGAQASKPDPSLLEVEKYFFNRGSALAFSTMLRNPSIDMIAVFLLMSWYACGACHRNAASMYLGVASRAATILGLQHQESYLSITPTERQRQLRTWMSLRIFDLLVSSILARPSSAPPAGTSDALFGLIKDAHGDRSDLIAQYELVKIIDAIIEQVYGQKAVSTTTAESLLDRLKSWTASLPSGLQPASSPSLTPQQSISALHLSSTYYFAATLITRPFLISTLTARMARLSNNASHFPATSDYHDTLSSVCVDSAIFLIRSCLEASHASLLLSNMVLLKALVFSSALILGFSLFAQQDVDLETDAMFNGAKDILQGWAGRSSQAAHYVEILEGLGQTVQRQRQNFALGRRRRGNGYVGQLFGGQEADNKDGGERVGPGLEMGWSDLDVWMQGQGFEEGVGPTATGGEQGTVGTELLGWDCLDLGLWDSFPFVNQA